MAKVVDVRFRDGGKTYRFDANDLNLKAGDKVIVDNQKGKAFAYVAGTMIEEEAERKKPLKRSCGWRAPKTVKSMKETAREKSGPMISARKRSPRKSSI